MKLRFRRLEFEITRKCNQDCKHCCRGKCQNMDLTKEIVDSFFDNNGINYISTLVFTGGELTLNPEMVEYIVDKIIERKIEVDDFITSTNGLIYNETFARALDKLNAYCLSLGKRDDRCGAFFISASQFHQKPSKEAIEGYLKFNTFIPYEGEKPINVNNLEPYGNAVSNKLTNKVPDLNAVTDYANNYKIVEYQGETYMVIKNMYISSNGNILMDGCLSYDLMDTLNIGNIKNDKIDNIFISTKTI